ncbi:37S ribosomal protein Rsm24, putative [Cordyceps militaris CM01]|uniref:37S ribosomal protein Rsm24, putative n=1 Tax=Cordyceps militaris (strain CM01) TaxID=983644 RepID=G3JTJ0_CORMM|nr:37S ribosomal protein Rsm24, putative [Cordyceps militaris CM01]EGX87994.1 37S ribosomal protein Rsm24, putative [Cordyceps militaris CM01]
MASAPRVARICAVACRRAVPQLAHHHMTSINRTRAAAAFSTSSPRAAERAFDGDEGGYSAPVELKALNKAFTDRATPEGLQQLDRLAKLNGHNTIEAYLNDKLRYTPGFSTQDKLLTDELVRDDSGGRPDRRAFWYDEDDPDTFTGEHDEFNEDDMMSMAHNKLDEVREMRHYTRLAVWEMPLLSKLAKPFELPKTDQVLRWRYTTYMGEAHPAESKVVVQFTPPDLGLTDVQTDKLRKLAGARLNPATDVVQMSCGRYEHQAQNKRSLEQLVQALITAAKDPRDTFADVALDTRHYYRAHKARKTLKKPKFPPAWRMTPRRQIELAAQRAHTAVAEARRADKGLLVDGQRTIDGYLMQRLAEEQKKVVATAEAEAVPVPVGRGPARARR